MRFHSLAAMALVLLATVVAKAQDQKPHILVTLATTDQNDVDHTSYLVRFCVDTARPQSPSSWSAWFKYNLGDDCYVLDYELPGMVGTEYAREEAQFIDFLDRTYMPKWRDYITQSSWDAFQPVNQSPPAVSQIGDKSYLDIAKASNNARLPAPQTSNGGYSFAVRTGNNGYPAASQARGGGYAAPPSRSTIFGGGGIIRSLRSFGGFQSPGRFSSAGGCATSGST